VNSLIVNPNGASVAVHDTSVHRQPTVRNRHAGYRRFKLARLL